MIIKTVFYRVLTLLFLLTACVGASCNGYKVIPKSSKPSLSVALRGVKGYTIARVSNGRDMAAYSSHPFIDEYFVREIVLWMSKICPDAHLGENYNVPSCGNIQIAAQYKHNGYYAYNGIYYWNVGAFVIEIIFGERDYVYQYKLPAFSVQGNYFGDHTLSNLMMRNICQYVCHYDRNATLQLEKVQTGWTEAALKRYFDEEGNGIEGIYESTTANTNGHTSKYKLALKKNNDPKYEHAYDLIYLSGVNEYRDWVEGEIKAYLYSTGTTGVFKANWLMRNKSLNKNYYVTLKEGAFVLTDATSSEELYLQLYPTAQNRKPKQPKSWSGSGFALNNGYVVTNFHVADRANTIIVYQFKNDGTRQGYSAKMVASDKTNDIAILRITDPLYKGFGTVPYKIKTGMSEVGESVWTLGYPMADIMGDEVKFTDGKISARSGIDGETSVYQISVPIQHGNSGGPLLDTKGNIVGITSSTLNRNLQAENVNYAIKSSYLRLLVENSLPTSILPQGTALQGQTLTTQIKLAKNFVFYIECSMDENATHSQNTSKSNAPTPSATHSNPEQMRPTLTPAEAVTILHGTNASEKQKAYNALIWWANNGDAEACGYLGICNEFGIYVNKNINTAIEWFKKGATGEDPRSMHELGVFYCEGEGVPKDLSKAKDLFLRAARKEYIASYSALGELYFDENDPENAVMYLEKGAAAHSESAYYLLLDYYLFKKRDPNIAYTYLEMELYDREHGTIVDAYRENGYRFEYYMGYYYEFGLTPLPKDLNKAVEWYKKAANHGDRDSKKKLEKLQEEINKAPIADVSSAYNVSYRFPKHRRDDKLSIVLTEVSITNDATTLKFSYYNWEYAYGGWIKIAKKAYLVDTQTNMKYYLKEVKGIAISPKTTSVGFKETKNFSLIFEPIPRSCHRIDFIESPKSEWQIRDIELQ